MKPRRWHLSLAARYAAVMAGFVVVGSLLLLAWLNYSQEHEAVAVFAHVARNDADFVRRLNLPRSPRLARDLSQLLRSEIYFRELATGKAEPPLPEAEAALLADAEADGEILPLPGGRQALVLPLDARHEMVFIQSATGRMALLWQPSTAYALLAFWLFAGVFGWVLGHQVLRPVRRLTHGLGAFFQNQSPALPGTDRPDEIGELARTLAQAREELHEERLRREQSERLALLGRVAAGLAHEIRNPLASIQLHAQLMDSESLDPEGRSSLQHLLAEIRVIEGLVSQWLYLARPAPPRRQALDLVPMLEETVEMLKPQARHADVELVLTVDNLEKEAAPTVSGDRQRLQQVFRNLILNGVQAMPSGGKLEVKVTVKDACVILTFSDEGAGFSREALERGKDLFFTEKEGGMGVGLNVATEIISAHGGEIWLKNRPHGGAVVEIRLQMHFG